MRQFLTCEQSISPQTRHIVGLLQSPVTLFLHLNEADLSSRAVYSLGRDNRGFSVGGRLTATASVTGAGSTGNASAPLTSFFSDWEGGWYDKSL